MTTAGAFLPLAGFVLGIVVVVHLPAAERAGIFTDHKATVTQIPVTVHSDLHQLQVVIFHTFAVDQDSGIAVAVLFEVIAPGV